MSVCNYNELYGLIRQTLKTHLKEILCGSTKDFLAKVLSGWEVVTTILSRNATSVNNGT